MSHPNVTDCAKRSYRHWALSALGDLRRFDYKQHALMFSARSGEAVQNDDVCAESAIYKRGA